MIDYSTREGKAAFERGVRSCMEGPARMDRGRAEMLTAVMQWEPNKEEEAVNTREAAEAIGQEVALESRAGPDLVISDVKHILDRVEKIAIDRIDTLINRLTTLKSIVVMKNRRAVDEVAGLINKVDQGMKDVSHFEELVEELERMTARRE